MLSDSGHDVVVADRRAFPRDKVCGDGLISDALGALMILGIRDRIESEAWHGSELRVYAPGGRHVSLRGEFAALPRARLDALLLEAAIETGARFVPGMTAVGPLMDGDRVAGGRFKSDAGEVTVRARFTILATGANTVALDAFGLPTTKKPDAVAGRVYYEAPPDVAARVRHLTIAYDGDWCPGYGWIFPAPGNRFNVGVGLFTGAAPARLREFWDVFRKRFPPAAALIDVSTPLGEFHGAPMRSGLHQPRFGRPGLLAAGEAVSATYSATGEGIGKAMESGMLAAVLVADALAGQRAGEGLEEIYGNEFRRRFQRRYDAYGVAQRWAASPWLLNLLAQRASAGRFVRSELEALVSERGDARALFSLPGLLKALVR